MTGTQNTATDWAAKIAQWKAEREAELAQHRETLLATLRGLGVTLVEGEYDGYGDTGNSDLHQLTPAIEIDPYLDNQLTEFFWAVAYNENPGFENNDGAFGEITWDVTADTICLTHNARFTDHCTTEHEGL